MTNCNCGRPPRIMRGDQYPLCFDIRDENGILRPESISEIEFVIDKLVKKYPDEADYDEEERVYRVFLTQEDTFSIHGRMVPCQVRIKFKGSSDVIGVRLGSVEMQDSLSKAVL